MLHLTVALPSGRSANLALPESATVEDLKVLANQSFGRCHLRLITSEDQVLTDLAASLRDAGLKDKDILTAVVPQVKVAATQKAFALWCLGGDSVAAWGDPNCGGDSSSVQDQLKNVQQVPATRQAFAAILADGSVVTWGDRGHGGDSSSVQDQLKNVQQVQATSEAFAAILADGSVVTWGSPSHGGDSSSVQDQLKNVEQVQAIWYAFAAILADGSVVTWGFRDSGGYSSSVQDQLRNL